MALFGAQSTCPVGPKSQHFIGTHTNTPTTHAVVYNWATLTASPLKCNVTCSQWSAYSSSVKCPPPDLGHCGIKLRLGHVSKCTRLFTDERGCDELTLFSRNIAHNFTFYLIRTTADKYRGYDTTKVIEPLCKSWKSQYSKLLALEVKELINI